MLVGQDDRHPVMNRGNLIIGPRRANDESVKSIVLSLIVCPQAAKRKDAALREGKQILFPFRAFRPFGLVESISNDQTAPLLGGVLEHAIAEHGLAFGIDWYSEAFFPHPFHFVAPTQTGKRNTFIRPTGDKPSIGRKIGRFGGRAKSIGWLKPAGILPIPPFGKKLTRGFGWRCHGIESAHTLRLSVDRRHLASPGHWSAGINQQV